MTGDAATLVDVLRRDPELGERVAHVRNLEPRPARYGEPADGVADALRTRLEERGIDRLYVHQARAVDLLRSGTHVVVATGTASGKSLCYQIPVLESALSGDPRTALMLFPTKALAQDQLRSLRSWLVPGLDVATYDGDTPKDARSRLRRDTNVVLTNPDMLHVGILPRHERWARFFSALQIVVVDELHVLRGIFGSHVAHLLRRLRRVCAHYGSEPSFCFSSATIGNPGALAEALCGLNVETVDDDGAPSGERRFVLWERPLVDASKGSRASANYETARVVARLVSEGLHVIAFTRSRTGAELVASHARGILEADGSPHAGAVAAYRGGYLPEERRDLEERLVRGDLRAVAATNALELGIDVGRLDAVALNGFPGTLASMWQQAGRAGRERRGSIAVLVAGDDQLDQWYLAHPDELFGRTPEPAVVNPSNPYVLRPHVACAAYELPLVDADAEYFGDSIDEAVRDLVAAGDVRVRAGRAVWAARRPPASGVGLRTGGSDEFRLVREDSGEAVGTVDSSRVFNVAHEGAVYLHQGRQYRVTRLSDRDRTAWLEETDDDEYTQAREESDLSVEACDASRPIGTATVHLGAVAVTTLVTGYQRKRASTGEVIGTEGLDLPARDLPTRACWYTIPDGVVSALEFETPRVLGALHAAEHALIGMLPLFAICDRWDVGGLSIAHHPDTGLPSIFVYDGYPGGAGVAELAYEAAERHVAATLDLVRSCPCESGCPSCIQSPKCGNWNEYLDKEAAVALLDAVLDERTGVG